MFDILVILLLVLANGVFSGSEIAILSVRKTRVQELVEGRVGGAAAVAALREDPERFLATVQIGITVISSTASAFGGAALAERLAAVIAAVPVAAVAERAEPLALGGVVAMVSFLSLVLGELVPKSLALRTAETYALLVSRPLTLIALVARPIVWLLTTTSNLVLRLFGDRTSFMEARLSSEELRQMVIEASQHGSVDRHSGDIAARALQFAELDVESLMVSRSELVSVPRDVDLAKLADPSVNQGKSRVLVTRAGNIDDIVGYLTVRDVLARRLSAPDAALDDALVHPVPFVPPTMTAPALLRELQERRLPMAVVVHEQGTVLGIVTVEDLLEELVGELMSEGDAPPSVVAAESDGSYVVDGRTPLHELARDIDPPLHSEMVTTIGGLAAELAGRIPAAGAVLPAGNGVHEIEVLEASHRRVRKVRIRKIGGAAAAS